MLNLFLIQHSYKRSGASLSTRIAPSIPSKSTPPEQPFPLIASSFWGWPVSFIHWLPSYFVSIIFLFIFFDLAARLSFLVSSVTIRLSFNSKLIIIAAPKLASNRTPPEQSFQHIAPFIPSRSKYSARAAFPVVLLLSSPPTFQVSFVHWLSCYFDSTIF